MPTSELLEKNICCPFCGESISISLDFSGGDQSYIEDCQVCCQPIQLSFECEEDQLVNLTATCA